MFTTSELADWLAPLADIDRNYFYSDDQNLDEIEQDTAVVLSLRGGGSAILERTYDRPTVQVQLRGPQFDPGTAEAMAHAIDDALLAPTITEIGTTRVISLDRLGGPPTSAGRDGAHRNLFTCSYTFQAARTTF